MSDTPRTLTEEIAHMREHGFFRNTIALATLQAWQAELAAVTAERDRLQVAICQAVGLLNMYPTKDNEPIVARMILREALSNYADAIAASKPAPSKAR